MMFFKIHTNERASDWLKALLIVSSCGAIAVLITYVLYGFTQDLLVERLRERLTAIVSTASLRFSAEDVESISSYEDSNKPAFAKIVEQLDELRSANKNLQYAYIMRRTDDPNTFEFVADADSLSLLEDIDENGNGILDEEEQPPMPGDPYDVSEYPVLRDEAFYYPVAEHELASDQWGSLLAAFAPIRDSSGNTVAILGVDVIVTDFMQVTRATLMPFLLFVLFLILMLALLSLMLLRINRERIKALQEIDRQKDELISIVSHQLNTPVSAVKWNIEMFLDGDLGKMSDEQTKQLNLMQSELASLADLVSMLLDVSRIQLGRMKVSRAELDLAAFFAEELAVIEPKAKENRGPEKTLHWGGFRTTYSRTHHENFLLKIFSVRRRRSYQRLAREYFVQLFLFQISKYHHILVLIDQIRFLLEIYFLVTHINLYLSLQLSADS